MAIRPHPLTSPASSPLLSSPLSDLHSLSWTWAAASNSNGTQATWRCTIVSTIRTVHFVAFPPLDPPLIQSLRTMQDTQVSHITAEGWLCLSRGGWGKKRGGCRYYLVRTSPHRYPPLDRNFRTRRVIQHMGAWTNLADATTPCLHAGV
jgi:hypothetical protein